MAGRYNFHTIPYHSIQVITGVEGLQYEAGPFHWFAAKALESATPYIPDYTVSILSEKVTVFQVSENIFIN